MFGPGIVRDARRRRSRVFVEGNAAQCRPNLGIERGTMKNGPRTALNKYRSYETPKRKYYFHIRASCLASRLERWTMPDDPITAPSHLSPLSRDPHRKHGDPCFNRPRDHPFPPLFLRSFESSSSSSSDNRLWKVYRV